MEKRPRRSLRLQLKSSKAAALTHLSAIEKLPPGILEIILRNLSPHDLVRAQGVSNASDPVLALRPDSRYACLRERMQLKEKERGEGSAQVALDLPAESVSVCISSSAACWHVCVCE